MSLDHVAHVHRVDASAAYASEHLPPGGGGDRLLRSLQFPPGIEAALLLKIYAPQRSVEAMLQSREYFLKLLSRVDPQRQGSR